MEGAGGAGPPAPASHRPASGTRALSCWVSCPASGACYRRPCRWTQAPRDHTLHPATLSCAGPPVHRLAVLLFLNPRRALSPRVSVPAAVSAGLSPLRPAWPPTPLAQPLHATALCPAACPLPSPEAPHQLLTHPLLISPGIWLLWGGTLSPVVPGAEGWAAGRSACLPREE